MVFVVSSTSVKRDKVHLPYPFHFGPIFNKTSSHKFGWPCLSARHSHHLSRTPDKQTSLPQINPYSTAFPYGNGMVLHFYQQQESSTTKTVHKVINKGIKAYV